jgi:hypothetical protein
MRRDGARGRLAFRAVCAAVVLAIPGVAVSASGGGKSFATGLMAYGPGVLVSTFCQIPNVGVPERPKATHCCRS